MKINEPSARNREWYWKCFASKFIAFHKAKFGNLGLQNNGLMVKSKCSFALKIETHEIILDSVGHFWPWQNFIWSALEILLIPVHPFRLYVTMCTNCHLRGMQATCFLRSSCWSDPPFCDGKLWPAWVYIRGDREIEFFLSCRPWGVLTGSVREGTWGLFKSPVKKATHKHAGGQTVCRSYRYP